GRPGAALVVFCAPNCLRHRGAVRCARRAQPNRSLSGFHGMTGPVILTPVRRKQGDAMALHQEGDYSYGDGPADVWDYFVRLTRGKPFVDEVKHWKQAVCPCGRSVFYLLVDEESQTADRVCTACEAEHRILYDPEDLTGDPELDEQI